MRHFGRGWSKLSLSSQRTQIRGLSGHKGGERSSRKNALKARGKGGCNRSADSKTEGEPLLKHGVTPMALGVTQWMGVEM